MAEVKGGKAYMQRCGTAASRASCGGALVFIHQLNRAALRCGSRGLSAGPVKKFLVKQFLPLGEQRVVGWALPDYS